MGNSHGSEKNLYYAVTSLERALLEIETAMPAISLFLIALIFRANHFLMEQASLLGNCSISSFLICRVLVYVLQVLLQRPPLRCLHPPFSCSFQPSVWSILPFVSLFCSNINFEVFCSYLPIIAYRNLLYNYVVHLIAGCPLWSLDLNEPNLNLIRQRICHSPFSSIDRCKSWG